ncbi:antibiotic biosynthesis monooxygenase [Paraphotobacterium marinum]|uniref:Antibiotic biosynthesis monooxygenase n=1 Tax=Paraphotobacterium marinum TaxID=1755811 RepID=A0A220VG61_9GAMM|nr:antibiotic biosynthesis monooxygenase [Paraphotobacterium marinum]ASK79319.1 antibiotic biosynthesis monooxygenase [Paraphotobacterium marinum]
MFVVVYEFEIFEGKEKNFRESWLKVTESIFKHFGSFGSRLHHSEKSNVMIGYAQWPNREQWQKGTSLKDRIYESALNRMLECLIQSKIVYKLEVSDDFFQLPNLTSH